jgi:hypothetical protein
MAWVQKMKYVFKRIGDDVFVSLSTPLPGVLGLLANLMPIPLGTDQEKILSNQIEKILWVAEGECHLI